MLQGRDKRIAELIKDSLNHLFSYEMSDPRVPETVNIRHVEVTPDLRNAKVYYTQDPDDRDARRAMDDLLETSAGFIRSRVAEDVNIKRCPTLTFHYDKSARQAERIEELLNKVNTAEKKTSEREDA